MTPLDEAALARLEARVAERPEHLGETVNILAAELYILTFSLRERRMEVMRLEAIAMRLAEDVRERDAELARLRAVRDAAKAFLKAYQGDESPRWAEDALTAALDATEAKL